MGSFPLTPSGRAIHLRLQQRNLFSISFCFFRSWLTCSCMASMVFWRGGSESSMVLKQVSVSVTHSLSFWKTCLPGRCRFWPLQSCLWVWSGRLWWLWHTVITFGTLAVSAFVEGPFPSSAPPSCHGGSLAIFIQLSCCVSSFFWQRYVAVRYLAHRQQKAGLER